MRAVKYRALLDKYLLELGHVRFKLAGRLAVSDAQCGGNTGGLTGHDGLLQEAVVRGAVRGYRLARDHEVLKILDDEAAVRDIRGAAVLGAGGRRVAGAPHRRRRASRPR